MSTRSSANQTSATISVVIPVFDDEPGLVDTVESLLAADPRADDQIIVADNGSTDGSWQRALDYATDYPDLIVAVREEDIQGSYAARNRGIDNADGDILCFVDADMRVPSDYFESIRRRFADDTVDYLACDVRLTSPDTSLAGLYNCATGFRIRDYLEHGNYAPTCCLCIRRECIDRIGRFDQRLESGGDMEFGKRAHRAGLEQGFAPDIILEHPARTSYLSLLKKECRIGRGHAQLSHLHSDRFSLFEDLYVNPARYLLPTNPVWLYRQCRQRELDVGPATLAALAVLEIPLAWAGILAFLRESRRLEAGRTQTPTT